MQLITQSFVTYLKRVTLIALLAVLGYGIGIALRPADSSLLAVPTYCNHEFCVELPGVPGMKACMVDRLLVNATAHCTNFWNDDYDTHDCFETHCVMAQADD